MSEDGNRREGGGREGRNRYRPRQPVVGKWTGFGGAWKKKGKRAAYIGWTWTGEPFTMQPGTEFAMLRNDQHEPGTRRPEYNVRILLPEEPGTRDRQEQRPEGREPPRGGDGQGNARDGQRGTDPQARPGGHRYRRDGEAERHYGPTTDPATADYPAGPSDPDRNVSSDVRAGAADDEDDIPF